jgi:hypothetical protein
MRTLVVVFKGSNKEYHYCYAGRKEVKPGDFAIIHNGSEFSVVDIRRAIPGVEPRVTKYVLAVITQADFEAYLEQNTRIEEYRQLEDQLAYRLKLKKHRQDLRDMAQGDTEAMALLDRLEAFERTTTPAIEAETAHVEEMSDRPVHEGMGTRPVTREDVEAARPAGEFMAREGVNAGERAE